jgi:signal transduction histidine kinase
MLSITVFAVILIIYFNSRITYVFSLFHIEEQKNLAELSLKYNKELYLEGTEDEKEILKTEFKEINIQQAFIWLLDTYESEIINQITVSVIILSLVLLAIISLMHFLSINAVFSPFQKIITSLTEYSDNHNIRRIKAGGNRKLRQILENYNSILQKIENNRIEENIANSIKSWQSTARIMVHEIKNSLSPVTLSLEYIEHCSKNDLLKNEFSGLKTNISSMEKIINSFRNFVKLPAPLCKETDIIALTEQIIDKYKFDNTIMNISVKNFFPKIFTDSFYMELIIVNLIKNSVEALNKEEKSVNILFEGREDRKIIIRDNGSGIKKELLIKLFKPGFTTKKDGDGIGLFLVKELCTCLNIKLTINSMETEGTEAVLDFGNT